MEFIETLYESDDEFICDICGAELELIENTYYMCWDCEMEDFTMD